MTGPSRAGLACLLAPKSVAVVGAGDDARRFGGAAVHNLLSHGYQGRIHFVSRSRDTVAGQPTWPSVSATGEPVDCAVLVVAADATLDVAAECRDHGVASLVVVASGFGEGGSAQAGRQRLARLREIVDGSGMVVLGPSTTGLSNLLDGFVPRAAGNQVPADQARAGGLALISQSGAVNNIAYNRAQAHGVGVGYAVATGLQAFCDVWDVAGYAVEDDRVHTVAMLLEDAGPAAKAAAVCRRARQLGKSVLALKLGRTQRGAAAVRSHSGALAGEWAVQREVLTAAGATAVDDIDQVWEVAMLRGAWGAAPRRRQPGLGVFAFSGGEGALIADQADEAGIALPPPAAAFRAEAAALSPLAEVANPFDPTGDVIGREEQFVAAVRSFVAGNGAADGFDAYLVAAPIQGEMLRRPMRLACQAVRRDGQRVAASLWSVAGVSDGVEADLRTDGVPLFDTSHRAVAAIARYFATAAPVRAVPAPDTAADLGRLSALPADATYWQVRSALADIGVPVVAGRSVADPRQAAEYAAEVGFPVVVKGDVPSGVHKSAAGLVRLGLRDAAAVVAAVRSLQQVMVDRPEPRVVVEPYVFGDLQVYVGAKRDPGFGPVVLFGAGGSAVEFARDVAIAPAAGLTADAARELVGRSRVGAYLAGRSAAVTGRIADVVVTVARAMTATGIAGIDLNPLVVDTTAGTVTAIDARVVRQPDATAEEQP